MDENNFSAPPVNMLNTNDENLNVNSNAAPPELPLQEEVNTKDGEEKITAHDDKDEQNNNNNQEQEEEEYEEMERPMIRHNNYYDEEEEIGCCRKTFQYIFIVALYGLAIWGIILTILYGGYIGIIDDVSCIILASIMLYLTIKNRTTGGMKMGLLSVFLFFSSSVIRSINIIFMSSNIMSYVILFVVRGLFSFVLSFFNCKR